MGNKQIPDGKHWECYLCGSSRIGNRPGKVRDNQDLQVLECQDCGLVFISSFDHITDSFYIESGMHTAETDLERWIKETRWDDERRFCFLGRLIENRDILDFGCGNGAFLQRACSIAKSVQGVELEEAVRLYMHDQGIKVWPGLEQATGTYDVITAFHVLEHLPDPVSILMAMSKRLNIKGRIIIEVPSADDILLKMYRNPAFVNFTYWSCHLYLFNAETIKSLARKAGLHVEYIKQIQRYPLSNHLHWLVRGLPGGHQQWSFMDSPELNSAYEKQLASLGMCDTLMASLINLDREVISQ